MMLRRVDRVAVNLALMLSMVGLCLCLCVAPPSPLAAGLGALRPLRPRSPVAVDGAGFLVARVYL